MSKIVMMYHTANFLNKRYSDKIMSILEKYDIEKDPKYLILKEK